MKAAYRRVLLLFWALCLPGLSGCWNYTEVDDISIVSGVAIDKDPNTGKPQVTVEMIDTKGGLDQNQANFKMLSLTGSTEFEIVREMISMTGKKLFWSHAKAIIFSEDVAREGLVKAMDWYSRDTETRSDVFIFVSNEKTAREVLNINSTTEAILSFELAQMMRDEKYVGTAPVVEIWDFIDKLETSGRDAVAPLISIHEEDGHKNERVTGTAIFVKDKMVGKLNGDETKSMLFANNKIKGGVLKVDNNRGIPSYSLEILSNRTKVKPKLVNGKIEMHIETVTETGLDEVMSSEGLSGDNSIKIIEDRAAKDLREGMLSVIRKVQREYQADIFGFGETVHENLPKAWSRIKGQWSKEFSDIEVTVSSKVVIKSTAKTSRAIRLED